MWRFKVTSKDVPRGDRSTKAYKMELCFCPRGTGFPHLDADGDTQYDNTHYDRFDDALLEVEQNTRATACVSAMMADDFYAKYQNALAQTRLSCNALEEMRAHYGQRSNDDRHDKTQLGRAQWLCQNR